MKLPEPDFIERNPEVITQELVAQYEQMTGKNLYPAQVERLLIDMIAYRESVVRTGIQEVAKQNLVAFAKAPMLDYLGELVGVSRLPAKAALTTLKFSLPTSPQTPVVIPAGTRVETSDGAVSFATDVAVTLDTNTASVEEVAGIKQWYVLASAACELVGAVGNDWQAGKIIQLISSLDNTELRVSNITVTTGGVEAEDDDRLRERIKLAPESFSTAGSKMAYRFHALKAHQDIVDVAVLSPKPGVVKLYPLMAKGLPSDELLAKVNATCSADQVRPLTDSVEALKPELVEYDIRADLTFYSNVDRKQVMANAKAQAEAYCKDRAAGLGRDIVPSQVLAALQVPGVYQVELKAPSLKVLLEHQWASCKDIKLNDQGEANG
ncbi:baseplate assembly protein [Chitinivorax tropicus]|uniref:baseplate assembly protein n=1 Tax=Chitinivorax tropicus TaxID=714531 RepID=UPI00161D87E4|nr:baseplate J/gp47 family protein [Chitinivorax tropicus]